MGAPDDKVEIVPITDQVAAKVQQAVDEVEDEPLPPSGTRPQDLPAIELGEAAPASVGEVMHVPSERWLAFKRAVRGSMKALIAVAVLAVIAAAFFAFSDTGREMLPSSMQDDADRVARKVERRVRGSDETFYQFTDNQGVVHIVDHFEKVPKQYRKRAEKKR